VNAPIGTPATLGHDGSVELDGFDREVLRLFQLVRQALAEATDIFLATDRDAARALVARDELIDAIHRNLEIDVLGELLHPGHDVERQQHLLLILQILPELERSGDLAEHIASHAIQGLAKWLTPRALSLISQMGTVGVEMWDMAAAAYAAQDIGAADRLRARDDEVDDIHVRLIAECAAGGISVPVAIEMGLVARYFERLGDHAVNVTRRLARTYNDPPTPARRRAAKLRGSIAAPDAAR
jgi:phosphate transport system protein